MTARRPVGLKAHGLQALESILPAGCQFVAQPVHFFNGLFQQIDGDLLAERGHKSRPRRRDADTKP